MAAEDFEWARPLVIDALRLGRDEGDRPVSATEIRTAVGLGAEDAVSVLQAMVEDDDLVVAGEMGGQTYFRLRPEDDILAEPGEQPAPAVPPVAELTDPDADLDPRYLPSKSEDESFAEEMAAVPEELRSGLMAAEIMSRGMDLANGSQAPREVSLPRETAASLPPETLGAIVAAGVAEAIKANVPFVFTVR